MWSSLLLNSYQIVAMQLVKCCSYGLHSCMEQISISPLHCFVMYCAGGMEVSQTLTFNAPGILCVSVTIMDDDIPNEPNMIFQLMLSVPAFPSVSDTLVITIVDDSDGEYSGNSSHTYPDFEGRGGGGVEELCLCKRMLLLVVCRSIGSFFTLIPMELL